MTDQPPARFFTWCRSARCLGLKAQNPPADSRRLSRPVSIASILLRQADTCAKPALPGAADLLYAARITPAPAWPVNIAIALALFAIVIYRSDPGLAQVQLFMVC